MHPTDYQPMLPRVARAACLVAGLLISACGSGGGNDASATAAAGSGSGTAPKALAFTDAPALPAAPATLPAANSRNICAGIAITGRRIENLSVPDGATCVLDRGTRIDGNLELGTGAELFARGIIVGGNVQGQQTGAVLLETSTVGGSVQLDRGGAATIVASTVEGSVQWKERAAMLYVVGTRIGADLQLFANRGGATLADNQVGGNIQADENRGSLAIDRNLADGNLQCKQNAPAPTGAGNRAASKEDQCAAL
ncbi:MAG: hypothetical protein AB7G13_12845 [Lautropia sp.]